MSLGRVSTSNVRLVNVTTSRMDVAAKMSSLWLLLLLMVAVWWCVCGCVFVFKLIPWFCF